MLDQNTTTLLAALLGGLLTAMGGFLANYYIQSSTNKIQKQKEIRNILEHIYKSTQNVVSNYKQILNGNNMNYDKYIAMTESLDKIESMVNLYLPPLKKEFLKYQEAIESSFIVKLESKPPEVSIRMPNELLEESVKYFV